MARRGRPPKVKPQVAAVPAVSVDDLPIDADVARRIVRAFETEEEKQARLRGRAFPAQVRALSDPARQKAVLCPRRAGKSMCDGIALVEAADEAADNLCLYIGLIRETAKEIMWAPILKRLDRELGLNAEFNETSLTMTLPNRSRIRLVGMDRDMEQLEKVLGPGYRRVIIDEAASFRIDLKLLITQYIRPAVADKRGDIWLTGTPAAVGPKNFFYRVTTGSEPGWSVHRWSTFDNPYMEAQWREELAIIDRDQPEYRETPAFRMMYLGDWYSDDSSLVYHYDVDRNGTELTPQLTNGAMGIDLGFNDDTAFVVVGWADYDSKLYVVWAEKEEGMILTDVASRIQALRDKFPFVGNNLLVDGAARQSVEHMRRRYGLPLIATEKRGKSDVIAMMDTDLRTGKIKLRPGPCSPLIEEWAGLVWDKRIEESSGRRVEHRRCANHCADAALYAWRWSRNYLEGAAPAPRLNPWSKDWAERSLQRLIEREEQKEAEERAERMEANRGAWWDEEEWLR